VQMSHFQWPGDTNKKELPEVLEKQVISHRSSTG
jgi:hypothetical protein